VARGPWLEREFRESKFMREMEFGVLTGGFDPCHAAVASSSFPLPALDWSHDKGDVLICSKDAGIIYSMSYL